MQQNLCPLGIATSGPDPVPSGLQGCTMGGIAAELAQTLWAVIVCAPLWWMHTWATHVGLLAWGTRWLPSRRTLPDPGATVSSVPHPGPLPEPLAGALASQATPPSPGRTVLPVSMLQEFKEISRCTSVEGIFARVRAAVLRLLPVQRATVLLVDETAGELRVVMSSDANSVSVPLDKGIAGAVVSSHQTCVVADAYADSRFDRSVDELTGYSTKSILAVPIFNHDETRVVAVLQALNKSDGRVPFDESDVVLLEVLAAHCSKKP